MANIKFKNIDKIKDKVKDTFAEIRSDPSLLLQIGNEYVEYVKFKTRSGKSLATGEGFPSLKPKTIASRKYLAEGNSTHPAFSPSRSNVTVTGQTLDSLSVSKIKASEGTVEIQAKGKRDPYKTKRGTAIKGQELDNSKILGYLKQKGFEIFGRDQAITKRISNMVRAAIRRKIASSFKK